MNCYAKSLYYKTSNHTLFDWKNNYNRIKLKETILRVVSLRLTK